jgi:hypothetical protein
MWSMKRNVLIRQTLVIVEIDFVLNRPTSVNTESSPFFERVLKNITFVIGFYSSSQNTIAYSFRSHPLTQCKQENRKMK